MTRAEQDARYKKAHPEGVEARRIVKRMIARGEIPPAKMLKCFDCGNPARLYDHHLGYSAENQLRLQPVCSACDGKRRSANRQVRKSERFPELTGKALALAQKTARRKRQNERVEAARLRLRQRQTTKLYSVLLEIAPRV